MELVPFDNRDGWIWWDGALVPWRDAKLHVLSHGLHYASAVFEGERAYSGNIFRLRDRHMAVAELFRRRADGRHKAGDGRVEAALAGDRADAVQGDRALHDRHDV